MFSHCTFSFNPYLCEENKTLNLAALKQVAQISNGNDLMALVLPKHPVPSLAQFSFLDYLTCHVIARLPIQVLYKYSIFS